MTFSAATSCAGRYKIEHFNPHFSDVLASFETWLFWSVDINSSVQHLGKNNFKPLPNDPSCAVTVRLPSTSAVLAPCITCVQRPARSSVNPWRATSTVWSLQLCSYILFPEQSRIFGYLHEGDNTMFGQAMHEDLFSTLHLTSSTTSCLVEMHLVLPKEVSQL